MCPRRQHANAAAKKQLCARLRARDANRDVVVARSSFVRCIPFEGFFDREQPLTGSSKADDGASTYVRAMPDRRDHMSRSSC